MENFDLAKHLTNGVENLVKNILRATLKNPAESAFMIKIQPQRKGSGKAPCRAERIR